MCDFPAFKTIIAYDPTNKEHKIIETTKLKYTGVDSGYKINPQPVGLPSYRLETGEIINKIDEDTYEIFGLGIKLRTNKNK